VLTRTNIPAVYLWSAEHRETGLSANAYLACTSAGNAVIDPLPLGDDDRRTLVSLGPVAKIVVLTAEREPHARTLAQTFGAQVVTAAGHREEILPHLNAIELADQGAPVRFAMHLASEGAIFCGDALRGAPAGGLSMRSAGEYTDVERAALSLRRLMQRYPRAVFPAYGYPVFDGAYDVLYSAVFACAGVRTHRINLDELEFAPYRDDREGLPAVYRCRDAEVGFVIGSRKLGYRVSTLDPGHRFCPMHGHAREEELFFVIDGEPSVRTPFGTVRCRKGDFIALPVGANGAHQLLNDSSAPATVMLLSRTEEIETCYYPDSDKYLIETEVPLAHGQARRIVRASPALEYFDGE